MELFNTYRVFILTWLIWDASYRGLLRSDCDQTRYFETAKEGGFWHFLVRKNPLTTTITTLFQRQYWHQGMWQDLGKIYQKSLCFFTSNYNCGQSMLSKLLKIGDAMQWYVPLISYLRIPAKFIVFGGAPVDQSTKTMFRSNQAVTFERINIFIFSKKPKNLPVLPS